MHSAESPDAARGPSSVVIKDRSPVFTIGYPYLSKLGRDSVGTDFQSVRKLTNCVYAVPLELYLGVFRSKFNVFYNVPYIRGYIT
jgi:hypothetical protein